MQNITLITAFTAGLLSFLSPCILPLIPAYIGFISGLSIEQLSDPSHKSKIIINTLLFIFGFSIVFIILGASATAIGQFIFNYIYFFNKIAGIIIIIFGLHIIGLLKINALFKEKRASLKFDNTTFITSFILGSAFAFGWIPCIGPILTSILI
ncbi:cytochrome c biogenesis CcdA family protein, partial [Candidatus Margulisiibacteriota bacterium]